MWGNKKQLDRIEQMLEHLMDVHIHDSEVGEMKRRAAFPTLSSTDGAVAAIDKAMFSVIKKAQKKRGRPKGSKNKVKKTT